MSFTSSSRSRGLQGPEAGDLVEELLVEGGALLPIEDDGHLLQRLARDGQDLGAQIRLGGALQSGEVELVQQALVELAS